MKYIDAEKLKAKIRELRSESCISESDDYYEYAKGEIIGIITSLQQEKPHESFCEENCKGYKDTGGKCLFGFNCSAKKAHEQPEVDLEKEIDEKWDEFVSSEGEREDFTNIARHFYELGKTARQEE